MKRKLFVVIALLIGGVLTITLALVLAKTPGRYVMDWRSLVTSYIAYKSWTPQTTIVQATKAASPFNFPETTNLVSYGEGSHYTVDTSNNDGEPGRTPYPTQDNRNATASSFRSGRPIPYPPAEVWCVLLKRSIAEGDAYLVVFANEHVDLYNAEWILHEGETAPFSPEFVNLIEQLNCDLDLTNIPAP